MTHNQRMNTAKLPRLMIGSLLALALCATLTMAQKAPKKSTAARYVPSGNDWPEWRGPNRDGLSAEKGLPEKWSINGENLLWKVPYGGRSTPIVMGNRVFLFNSTGGGQTMQE